MRDEYVLLAFRHAKYTYIHRDKSVLYTFIQLT